MRVNRLREILDGPFLLTQNHQTSPSSPEQRVRESAQPAPDAGANMVDHAVRED